MAIIVTLIYFFVLFSIPAIPIIIVFSVKARNRSNYIERYGYPPEAIEQVEEMKKLLDKGIITEEQFEQRKKQILNIK